MWHRKYVETESGTVVPVPAGGSGEEPSHGGGHGIHLPSPSYYPVVASVGFLPLGYGLVFEGAWWLSVAGAVILLVGLFGWALEPSVEE